MTDRDSAGSVSVPPRGGTELELLATLSRHFATSFDVQETLRQAILLIVQYVDAEGGSLFLLEDEGTRMVCHASVGPVDITGMALGPAEGIVGHCVAHNSAQLVRDTSQVTDFSPTVDTATGFTTRSVLCAPMTVQDTQLGAIELVNKRGGDGRFSESDLMILETLAASAALAILNARMAMALARQEQIRRELELAAEIQRSLLPKQHLDPFPVHGLNRPAHQVSGDFYDFFALPDGRLCFAVGDVAGKGINAALLMSKTASLFRCLGKRTPEPGILLGEINAELYETSARGMFVTMAAGLYDIPAGRITLSSAGHQPPLLHRRDGQFESIAAHGPPLGIVSPKQLGSALPQVTVDASQGAVLYLFTDGLTESCPAGGAQLGEAGVRALITRHADEPLRQRLESIANDAMTEPNAVHDDLTLLAVEPPSQAPELDNPL